MEKLLSHMANLPVTTNLRAAMASLSIPNMVYSASLSLTEMASIAVLTLESMLMGLHFNNNDTKSSQDSINHTNLLIDRFPIEILK